MLAIWCDAHTSSRENNSPGTHGLLCCLATAFTDSYDRHRVNTTNWPLVNPNKSSIFTWLYMNVLLNPVFPCTYSKSFLTCLGIHFFSLDLKIISYKRTLLLRETFCFYGFWRTFFPVTLQYHYFHNLSESNYLVRAQSKQEVTEPTRGCPGGHRVSIADKSVSCIFRSLQYFSFLEIGQNVHVSFLNIHS